ncbi:WhiB family transcriptional regulator [Streptomyces sp. NPDC004629]|uniref:WhiB family transcriptional regulator n=1 Tax=Streptomyces sp. NPDC004629 TaxID=3364705 RepID=UPI0036B144F8
MGPWPLRGCRTVQFIDVTHLTDAAECLRKRAWGHRVFVSRMNALIAVRGKRRKKMRTRLLPLLSDWEWQERAACRGMNSATFFSPTGERGKERDEREERARRICRSCEVIEPCAAMALDSKQRHGVWGGMSARERRHILSVPDTDTVEPAA